MPVYRFVFRKHGKRRERLVKADTKGEAYNRFAQIQPVAEDIVVHKPQRGNHV